MKTKTKLLAAGMFLAAVFNGFGQPASKAPKELTAQAWQNPAVLTLPRPDAADGEYTAPVGGLIEYMDTTASARSAFYRTVQP